MNKEKEHKINKTVGELYRISREKELERDLFDWVKGYADFMLDEGILSERKRILKIIDSDTWATLKELKKEIEGK